MCRWVDHVLCSLPFEESWYQTRGVAAHYLGHPYFDELTQQQLNASFVEAQEERPGIVIGLLPGSRTQEVEQNVTTLLGAAARIHAVRPDTRFLMACLKPEHRHYTEERLRGRGLPIEVHVGRTPEIIHLARLCIAVSGSVGLELLYRGKPSVVIYRAHWLPLFLSRFFRTCPYISLVNLLADRELYPEFLTPGDASAAVAEQVLHWLHEPTAYREVAEALIALRERIAIPGACQRTARYILDVLRGQADTAQGRAA